MTALSPLEQARQRIEAAARPSWKLAPAPIPTRSKLGGLPDGPIGGDWPSWQGRPQAFLAQLDLAELRATAGPNWLPEQGRLLFFYDQQTMPGGLDPADRGGWTVRYLPPQATATVTIPEDLAPFPEQRVFFLPAPSWPSPDRLDGIRALAGGSLGRLYDAYGDLGETTHRIGGWPGPIQNDTMEEECQLASMGFEPHLPVHLPEAEALRPGAKDWRLLLQLDSDDALDWLWGDTGRLYFWVREAEARAGNFTNCWMILQCC